MASRSSTFVPSDWAVLPALRRWKSGCGTRSSPARSSAIAACTIRCASSPRGSWCCGLSVRVLRSVSCRVHSWRLTIAFAGASTIHSPSSIALARTTSSSAVRRATFPISLRYIRTGSSIPIMSAESASSSSAVGSSRAFASSLTGASTVATASVASATRPGTITVARSAGSSPSSTSSPASSAALGSAPIGTSSASAASATGSAPAGSPSGSSPARPTIGSSSGRAAAREAAETALTSAAAARRRRGGAARTASTSRRSAGSWVIVVLQLGAPSASKAGWPARAADRSRVGSRCGGRSRS